VAGFADLVRQAQPALYAGGVTASATAGRTWRFDFTDVTDAAGDAIDLSAVTGTCEVLDTPGAASPVVAFTFDGNADGTFSLTVDETDTDGLYSGSDNKGRMCYWNFVMTDGTDSVQVWDARNSKFVIQRGA
jgi:hypothetical protein